MGCSRGQSVRQLPHLDGTPYQADTVLVAYAYNPERALMLLDSALLLGNVSDYRAQFIRAKIYSNSLVETRLDSAINICQQLLGHDSVLNDPQEKENILNILIATSRAKHDNELYLKWATQKATLCQQRGEETERWRTEADIGLLMTFMGQVDEGLQKLDEAITSLDAPGSIDRMDAFVVAIKRKINALNDLGRYEEVIPLAQRTFDRLDHYEQHANDYAEDSYRLSWSDRPSDRDRYLDFSRAQALAFMAQAYAKLSEAGKVNSEKMANAQKAREYLAYFDQSAYGQSFSARRLIAPAQMALGLYDEALATYQELARRMGSDTLNANYALILRERAIAANAKGHSAEAYVWMSRHAALAKVVNDSLHRSEAHEYAARYHAQEQQLMIQEKEAEAERAYIIVFAVVLIAIFAICFAYYFLRQKRIVSEKNRVLVRLINEQAETLSHKGTGPEGALFNTIDSAIRNEHLYANIALQRQDICDRFDISRHVLNDLLTEYADGLSFPQYINGIRIEEALRLLHDDTAKPVSAIANEVGFTPANLREQFKRKYGVTPAEYRQNL